MTHGPFWVRRPAPEQLRTLLRAARDDVLSYPEVGATQLGATHAELPAGYHHMERSADLGRAPGAFERATEGLRAWAPHRSAGVDLLPPTPPLVAGETILLAFRSFPFFVTAAGRIVSVVDEPDRYGFAYGTLPHHPERGEEAFVIERAEDGSVRFVIRAFSRPAHPLTKLGGPIGRAVQARVTTRYLEGLRAG